MNKRAILFNVFMILALLVGIVPAPAMAKPAPMPAEQPAVARPLDPGDLAQVDADDIAAVRAPSKGVVGEVKGATALARYIVLLQEPALALYEGGVAGLEATSPSATGARKLDPKSLASLAYVNYLQGQQAQFVSSLKETLGRSVKLSYQYQHAVNGVVVTLTPDEAAQVAQLPQVRLVERERDLPLDTDAGPAWIGAPGIWDGSTTGVATQGENLVAGIIDSGINVISPTVYLGETYFGHPSFVDPGPIDGYDYPTQTLFYGVCNPLSTDYDPTFPCNDKLIGAYDMQNDPVRDPNAPRDDNGHGSHTASTVAGNLVTGTVYAHTTTVSRTVSGVAPHMHIIAYDACYTDPADGQGLCPNTATTASANQAVADGVVDVINFSIGGGEAPWADTTSLAFLACRAAGIYVAASAGNEGPGPDTVGHNEPWVATTGASTHNRTYVKTLGNMAGDGTPPADMEGKGITGPYGPAQVVYAGNYTSTIPNDALCLNPFPAGTFNDEIVICDRGTNARVDKGANVLAGGAGGYVLANDAANGNSLVADNHHLPAIHITYNDGVTLKAWVAAGAVHTATLSDLALVVDPAVADVMADFSSRGESTVGGLLKPNIIAPGVDILAAVQSEAGYDFYGGTSMASPHHAGAAALLMSLHPEWTPAQVQSALMTAAYRDNIRKEDGVTEADPHDRGSGRVDLSQAGLAGLVLDETITNYQNADPDNGGSPKTLNIASMADNKCLGNCSWTRIVSSTLNYSAVWTASVTGTAGLTIMVDPVSFTLPAYGEQTLVITADVGTLPAGDWVFGEVILEPDDTDVAVAHLTLGVKPTTGILPDYVRFDTRRNAGSEWVKGIQTFEITDLTTESFGLVQATLDNISLNEHAKPTNDFPDIFFTDTGNVYAKELTVPADALRLLAEIADTTSPDLDMLLMYDADNDGVPELQDTVTYPGYCQSAAGGPWEYCSITNPTAGRWFAMVINFTPSQTGQPDPVTLATAVVPDSDAGNMTIVGPSAVPAGTPFDVQLSWDTPTMVAGDRWYGAFSLGSDSGNPGNIGVIPVDIIRVDDDVVKTVSPEAAFYGDTLTYTITVLPNVTNENLTYWLTDTIPAGLTYVPGSAQASAGTVDVTGNELTWNGTAFSPSGAAGSYNASTNATDPLCDTGFGGYVNLADFSIYPQSGIVGDVGAWTAFATQTPIPFYNVDQVGIGLTTDGFAYFDSASLALPANTNIPNPANPNEIAPILWSDLNIVYQANTRGVSLATAGATVSIIEYDDVEIAGGGPIVGDFEAIFFGGPIDYTPGVYEFVYAYDNIQNLPALVTVGAENLDASLGTEFLYGSPTGVITDGLIVCFDYFEVSFDPIEITYQVTVDSNPPANVLTNDVRHITDNDGALEATTSADVTILGSAVKLVSDTLIDPGALVTYTIVLTAGPEAAAWTLNDVIPSGFSFVNVQGANYVSATNSIEWSGYLGSGVAMMTEGFEDATFPPAGWATFRGENGLGTAYDWVRTTSTPYAGAAAAFVQYENVTGGLAQDWLVTSQFTPTASAPAIQFYMQQAYTPDWLTTYTVRVSTASQTNHIDFTTVQTYTENDFGTTYQPFSVDLSAYIGQSIYVAFVMEQDDGDSWYIDNVSWTELVAYPDTHVVTLTLQGETPGTYVNVAEINTQGYDVEVEAPEVVIYGPIPSWDKEIWINGAGPFAAGMFDVVPGDMVTIVDRVSVDYNASITFTLAEEWDAIAGLQAFEADYGTVTPGSSTLTWELESGLANTWYTLTKTFEVLAGYGWSGTITETLDVVGYPSTLEVPVYLNIPVLLEKDGPATADTGELITYTLTVESPEPILLNGSMMLTDVLPAGIEYAGNLTFTYGSAWYISGTNTIYWDNAMGKAHPGRRAGTASESLAATVKQADSSGVLTDLAPQSVAMLSPQATLLEEGFESGVMPPTGWSVIDGTSSTRHWQLVDTSDDPAWIHSGTYAGWVNYEEADQDEWLISPLMDLTGVQSPTVEFWVYANNNWIADAELQFLVIDGGGTFTNTLWEQSNETWPYPSAYYQLQIDLSAYEGQSVYLAWRYVGNNGDSIALDDILVTGDTGAPPPTQVTITFNALVTAGPGETVTNVAELAYQGTLQEAATTLEVNEYELLVNIVGNGTVTQDPLPPYGYSDVVTLTATPAANWEFAGWSGDLSGAANPASITMDGDKVVTATFTAEQPPTYTLDVTVVGSGTVTLDPPGYVYDAGTVVTLTAAPETGWYFAGWDGDLGGLVNPQSLTMNSDKVVTATFTAEPPPTYTLDVTVVGSGTVDLDPIGGVYVAGTVVELTAEPETGWDFAGWSGDLSGAANPANITMDGDKVVTATFTAEPPPTYTLEVSVVGSGTVTLDPPGGEYASGAVVTLTAAPETDWYFAGWSGDLGGLLNPQSLTMNSDKVVTATFTSEPPVTYTLDVTVVGSGTVALNPLGGVYVSGTVVALTAVPLAGWEFVGWSGDLSGAANPASITMDGDKAVTATFERIAFKLFLPVVMKNH